MANDERDTDGGDGSKDRKRRDRDDARGETRVSRSAARTGGVVSGASDRSGGTVLGSSDRSDDAADATGGTDPVADLHRSVGNRTVQRLHEAGAVHRRHATGAIQPSLRVSQPGDRDEREADRVADAVMRSEGPGPVVDSVGGIQRSGGGGGATSDGGSAGDAGGGAQEAVRAVQGGGQSLPGETQSFFESRFGQDFSDVSVHTGSRADQAARSINAEAFTTGSDIAFARGNYDPGSSSGKELLAHELTHVVQQGGSEPKASGGGDGGADVARSVDAPAVQRAAAGETQFGTYEVTEGDSLWAIANRFGVEGGPEKVAEWNDMSVEATIHPGDQLKLPAGKIQGGSGGESGTASESEAGSESGSGDGSGTGGSAGTGSAAGDGGWTLVDQAGEAVGTAAAWVTDLYESGEESGGGSGGEPAGERLVYEHKVSDQFTAKVQQIASNLGADPNHLMAIMAFETGGSFDPAQKNAAGSGATGLIQFMPSTAEGMGTSTGELAEMSAVKQLDYVAEYFQPHAGDLNSVDDFYMAVLWPAAVGESEEYVLFEEGTTAYDQNSGLDDNDDGVITKREAAGKVRDTLDRGKELLDTEPDAGTAADGAETDQAEGGDGAGAAQGGAAAGATQGAGGETYVVEEGESLAILAEKHGVTVAALKEANPEKLRTWGDVEGFEAGATIVIPASGQDDRSSGSEEAPPDWEQIRESWAEFGEELGAGAAWALDHLTGGDRDEGSGGDKRAEPEWVRIARGETGQKEVVGPEHNQRVIEYHETSNVSKRQEITDEIAWCGSFVNWVMGKAGYSGPDKSAWSQAWANWGKQVSDPVYGAIVVFHWGGGNGHVGFVVGKSGNSLRVLGGNQDNRVKESSYTTGSVKAYVVPNDYDASQYTKSLEEDVEQASGGGYERTR